MPTPDETPPTPPPLPVLIGDAAGELMREIGFMPGLLRCCRIGGTLALALAVPLTLLNVLLLYFIATTPSRRSANDVRFLGPMFVIGALLLMGGVLTLRVAAGVAALREAAAETAQLMSAGATHASRLDADTAARWRRIFGASRAFVAGLWGAGGALTLQSVGLILLFGYILDDMRRKPPSFLLLGVVAMVAVALLAFASFLCGGNLLLAARALRKLESIAKEKP